MVYLVTAVPALTLGFLAGLLTFKRATRWCPACGDYLRCAAGHEPHRQRGTAS